ncbi:alanyl-tRNA editing protein [Oceanobacillus massiliensis]|uniref:alanyl-tRNA editing protein n=1 Tax=Oceanobacillus massiliensis TaxID=1465765 RepID=UPI0002884C99|nr:alanyl-tRNA editing protein [Oceanobacillus massiliensis]
MTTKLYYSSPKTDQWKTNITEIIEIAHGYDVILEETAFYPSGGGQPCDLGSIDGITVLDVYMDGNEVVHRLEHLPETSNVTCILDWTRRFDHMQQHSGQHLLSAICLELFQTKTVSFHMGIEHVTIDVDQPNLTNEQLIMIEEEVNRQIYQNRNIHPYFVTNEQLLSLPLVKPPKVTENVRIVEIEGIEYNACGGTHVAKTGEIGIIKILKGERLKDTTRIHFKCGLRALQEFQATMQITNALSEKFHTGRKDILDRFGKWEEELNQLHARIANLEEQNNSYLEKELLSETEGNIIKHIFSDKSLKELQKLAAKIAAEHHVIVLFATTAENKIVLTHDGSKTLSCGAFYKEHLPAFNGKGGGSPKSAQAGFSSNEDVLRFFQFVYKEIQQEIL